jgi:hypothetical protein
MLWVFDDGGRAAAGYRGEAPGDCVPRAIAIAAQRPYREVYNSLARGMKSVGHTRSARNGVDPHIYRPYIEKLGFEWTATMGVGTGCKVHLADGEIPSSGRLICRLSRHLVAVIDGTIRDISDPSRNGTRCVYGYWRLPF